MDLPIQRERHTSWPKIEGSSLKGSIREAFEAKGINKEDINLVFGPEDGELHAGAITFTDARILVFPVRTLKGIFAWITCPLVLERFREDMEIVGIKINESFGRIKEKTVPNVTNIVVSGKVILDEYCFELEQDENTTKLAEWFSKNISLPDYWKEKLKKDLVILPNEDFNDFVNMSTEIIARTKIDSKTGTVVPGALWYEEYLPTDTILYALALASPIMIKDEQKKRGFRIKESELNEGENKPDKEAEKVLEFFKKVPTIIQIGGNQTVGKGIVRLSLLGGK